MPVGDTIVEERVCRDIAPCTATCYSIRGADGVRENGSAWMNNADLAERLAGGPGMNKVAAKDAVDGVFETIGDTLAIGEETRILGFGTFVARNRPGRTAGTPRTGENVTVAASTVPVLKTGKPLKNAVNSRNTAPMRLGRDPGTYEASEGQQVEIIRFRCDDRRCRLFLLGRPERRSRVRSRGGRHGRGRWITAEWAETKSPPTEIHQPTFGSPRVPSWQERRTMHNLVFLMADTCC